ncbi:MAG: DNA polymerase I, partial [Alphaproteobacteria bacterium]
RPKHLYLVDGSAYIFRAFHALPPMTRPDGTPINAVFGFTKMLMKLIDDANADAALDYVAVVFDTARVSFRNEIYGAYKANRPPPPDELVPQFALVRDATRALNLPCIEMQGFEADDIIATYARQAAKTGAKVTIVSSDKDLMQLVGGTIEMFDPMKNKPIRDAEVREKFGVGPDRVIDVQSLAGDSTDNVPGVPGIGVKTAAELINTYGDLETLLRRAGEIKQPKRRETLQQNAEKARISRQLVTLRDDVPMPLPFDQLLLKQPEPATLMKFLQEQGFRSMVTQMASKLGMAADAIPTLPSASKPADENGQDEPSAAAAPRKSPVPATGPAVYELVQDEGALKRWIERANYVGAVAFDTETTSLDAMQAELVGFSLSIEPGAACYVPVGHVGPRTQGAFDLGDGGGRDAGGGGGKADGAPKQIKRERALSLIKPLLEDPAVLKIGHNIKYDLLVLKKYAVDVTPVDDTMLLSYALEAGKHGHGMDELAQLILDHKTISYDEVTGTGKGRISFAEVPLDRARDYAAEDADITLRLHRALKPRLALERVTSVYETLDRPLIPVLGEMEALGIKVDRAELQRLSDDFAGRLREFEKTIYKLAGREFNIGSPKQLGEVLFDEMSLPGGKKGKTGAYGTGADVLEDLAAQGHDLPARVLDWRQLAKLKSTYTDALMTQINPKSGRVHTSYAMAIASTGRLSSTDPNLQNIPIRTEEGRKIRGAFVADKGHKLVSLDYSQIELRLLAHVADMKVLKDAFKEGLDIHALTASQVFGVPIKGMDPMVRRKAKAINFGIIYGISAFGLAAQLGIPQGEAAKYIAAYFERYPGIRDYMEKTKEIAHRVGYVTTPFGRRVHVPEINSKNPAQRNFQERAAINAPLQGGAADIIKRAMIRIPDALAAKRLSARMLLQVHDELLFEVRDAEIDDTIATVKKVMEGAALPAVEISVPLVVDAGTGLSWAQAH